MSNYLSWRTALSAALSAAIFAASGCGGNTIDDNAGGTGGTGGTAGASGEAGAGGTAGTSAEGGSGVDAGDVGGAGGSPGTGGAAGSGPLTPCDGIEGSYQLMTELNDLPVMTMVIREASGACEADVAPAWWPAARFDVAVTADNVSLLARDRGAIFGTYDTGSVSTEWELNSLAFPRQGAMLSTSFSAKGRYYFLGDDFYVDDDSELEGTVGPDTTTPQLRVRRKWPVEPFGNAGNFSVPKEEQWFGFPEALLPWDTVQVEANKPLEGLEGAITLVSTEPPGEPTGSAFVAGELAGVGTAAGSWGWSRFSDWQAVAGTMQAIDLSSSLTDASGQTLSPHSIPFEVLDVGPLHTALEFDTEAGDIGSWGNVTWDEAEGQLHLEAHCDGFSGVAMKLDTSQAQRIVLRVLLSDGLLVRATGASGQEYQAEKIAGTYGSWETFGVDVSGESMIGLSVVTTSSCHWSSTNTLLIDWIRVE